MKKTLINILIGPAIALYSAGAVAEQFNEFSSMKVINSAQFDSAKSQYVDEIQTLPMELVDGLIAGDLVNDKAEDMPLLYLAKTKTTYAPDYFWGEVKKLDRVLNQAQSKDEKNRERVRYTFSDPKMAYYVYGATVASVKDGRPNIQFDGNMYIFNKGNVFRVRYMRAMSETTVDKFLETMSSVAGYEIKAPFMKDAFLY
ncbi:hypothetical protein [Neptuniibacter sp. QD37_11]|uniref:hypothetical protein n=1 Tax=Neptuniibacter sp. QD37_11 TaxID=3398209 RepID=UPI0039F4ED00